MNKEEFEQLNADEQSKVFEKLTVVEKAELFSFSHKPDQLAKTLSCEEIYLVTKALDLEEKCEIIKHASLPQLLFISDLDCWKEDRVQPKLFVHWLETLLEASKQKLFYWFLDMDYEMVLSGFRGLVQVLKPESEYAADEVLGDKSYFTLDNQYYVLAEEENLDTVKRAIEVIYENHRGRYAALMEGLLWEVSDEMEEEAFRMRNMRLQERGFPDHESAIQIYKPLSRNELESFPKKNIVSKPLLDARKLALPHYLKLWKPEQSFLEDVLAVMQEHLDVLGHIEEEFAWLSNKVISSSGIDFSSEEVIHHGVQRVRHVVNIGLEHLSQKDVYQAAQILNEYWLELIFRWGMTQLLELQAQASGLVSFYWKGAKKECLEFLSDTHENLFLGLLKKVPQFIPIKQVTDLDSLRDFHCLKEVDETRAELAPIEVMHSFLVSQFPNLFHRIILEKKRNSEKHITLKALMGNLFVSYVLRKKMSVKEISEKEVQEFLNKGFIQADGKKRIKDELRDQFLEKNFTKEQLDVLKPLWQTVFSQIEEEIGGLDPTALDLRFIASVLHKVS